MFVLSKFGTELPRSTSKEALVIANGPSFKKAINENPDLFSSWPCIVTNTFALSDHFNTIKPKYYVWLDAHMWNSKVKSVEDTHNKLMQVDWEMYLLVPNFSKKSHRIKALISNKNLKIVFYNYVYYKGFKSLGHLLYKMNLCTPRAWNVTIISLFLAINMGFKKIILVGADHTWHENLHMSYGNVLHTKVEHFFEDKKEVKYVPFYKGGLPENGLNKAKDFFWIWSKTFEGYEHVADYMEYRKTMIYNGSPESFIDAFERLDISSLN